MLSEPLYLPANEGALLLQFGNPLQMELSPESIQRIHRLVNLLDLSPMTGLLDLTPAYSSLLVEFDPRLCSFEDVKQHLHFCLEQVGHIELPVARQLEIPVFYGGEYGADLRWCADTLGMTASQLVQAHCDVTYNVAFFGFLPGFAYLTGWPAKWSLPRLANPRTKVPAGSVGIAGVQCGIYPVESPGGWRILGRSPIPMLDLARENFATLELGAQVQFYPANPKAW